MDLPPDFDVSKCHYNLGYVSHKSGVLLPTIDIFLDDWKFSFIATSGFEDEADVKRMINIFIQIFLTSTQSMRLED